MFTTHLDKRPTIRQNDIREDSTILVTGHEDCTMYAHTIESYDCGCRVTRERDCDGSITLLFADHCDVHIYEPRINIPVSIYVRPQH